MNAAAFERLLDLRAENEAARAAFAAMRPRFDTMRNRHENDTAPAAVSAFQLFQTPPAIAARLVALLGLSAGARVLEPSAGLGRILDALAPAQPAEVVAVEIAPECSGALYKQDRRAVRIVQRDFLTVRPDDFGRFDAVAMNPPFHLRADVAHILHARQFLRPGGRLAALCMDTAHRAAALRDLCTTWEPLPAGSFSSEGTRVGVVLLSMPAPVAS